MNKLSLVQEISALYGGPIESLGPGSKERKSLLLRLAVHLNVAPEAELIELSKQELGRKIVAHNDVEWDGTCESSGQTITKIGLERILRVAREVRYDGGANSFKDFPPEELIERQISNSSTSTIVRGQKFRRDVLRAWGSRCYCCGLTNPVLLEAAHIVAVADKGEDVVTNGIPLCVLHHRMLDKKLISIKIENNKLSFIHSYNNAETMAAEAVNVKDWIWICVVPKEITCPPKINRDAFLAWCRKAAEIDEHRD